MMGHLLYFGKMETRGVMLMMDLEASDYSLEER